jgi:hypothetical protein
MSIKTQGSWIATINCLDASKVPTAIYFSDDGYKSSDGRYYQSRMKQPAVINITGNDGGLLNVMQSSSIGEIELDNTDGGLDYLSNYALDGRDCTLQLVYNDIVTTWFKGIVTRINQRGNSVYLTLKSLTEALDTPLVLSRYAGTGGVEGLTTDVMGNVKPRVYGQVINATPVLCFATSGVYQVSDLTTTTITAVYDKGVALTLGVNRASLALLLSTTPSAGTYDWFQGYFRLGTTAVQQITCSATDTLILAGDIFKKIGNSIQFSSGQRIIGEQPVTLDAPTHYYQMSAGTNYVINDVLNDGTPLVFGIERETNTLATVAPAVGTFDTYKGYFRINPPLQSAPNPSTGIYDPVVLGLITCNATDNDVSYATTYSIKVNEDAVSGAVAVLNTCGNIGIYVNSDITARSILDSILKSVGGFWWFGDSVSLTSYNSNLLNAALYDAPSITPDLTINNWQITSAERTAIAVGQNGLPYYSVLANYDKVETQQSDVLGATTDAWRARVLKGSLIKESADLTVKSYHPQSSRLSFESALKSEANISSVTDRLLLQFKSRCDIVNATCYFSEIPRITLNMTVKVFYNRLGYSQGVSFRLVGYQLDIKRKSITMQLVGYKV